MNLFIPPEGAMQFHCTYDAFHKVPVDFVIWVLPPVRRNSYPVPCDCKKVYAVLVESITSEVKKQGGTRIDRPHVCDCCGRIIE